MFLWPKRAFVFAFFLLVIIVGTGVWVGREWPAQLFPFRDVDRWAAEAAGIGAGAFLLAVFATALAFGAYVNSTEKPKLEISKESCIEPYAGQLAIPLPSDTPDIYLTPAHFNTSSSLGPYGGWQLRVVLCNSGVVAARYVAVRVSFQGVRLRDINPPLGVQRADGMPEWIGNAPHFTTFRWEGGADAIVHPNWPYDVPSLGQPDTCLQTSTYNMIADGTTALMTIEIIADDHKPLSRTYTLHFGSTPPPSLSRAP